MPKSEDKDKKPPKHWQPPSVETISEDIKKGIFTKDELQKLHRELGKEDGLPFMIGQVLFKKANKRYKIPKKLHFHWREVFIEEVELESSLIKNRNFSIDHTLMKLNQIFTLVLMMMRTASSSTGSQNSSK